MIESSENLLAADNQQETMEKRIIPWDQWGYLKLWADEISDALYAHRNQLADIPENRKLIDDLESQLRDLRSKIRQLFS